MQLIPQQKELKEGEEVPITPPKSHWYSPRIVKFPVNWRRQIQGSREEKNALKKTNQLRKENEEKLKSLIEKSQTVLFRCKAVFPFDFFPDEISIEPTQVNVCKNIFFFTSRANSIPIKNVADAIVQTSPFFANLKIVDQNFVENSVEVSFLKRNDAETARRIIQGLIVASKEGVDLAMVDPEELKKQVEDLGKMQRVTAN